MVIAANRTDTAAIFIYDEINNPPEEELAGRKINVSIMLAFRVDQARIKEWGGAYSGVIRRVLKNEEVQIQGRGGAYS